MALTMAVGFCMVVSGVEEETTIGMYLQSSLNIRDQETIGSHWLNDFPAVLGFSLL